MSNVVYLLGAGASYGKRHEITLRGIGDVLPNPHQDVMLLTKAYLS